MRADVLAFLADGPLPLAKLGELAGSRSTVAKLLVELLRSGDVCTVGSRGGYMYVLTSREHERPSDQLP